MSTMDDLLKLIQDTETAKNDTLTKTQAVEAANAAAAAATGAANRAAADRNAALAVQAAKVEEVLTLVHALYDA